MHKFLSVLFATTLLVACGEADTEPTAKQKQADAGTRLANQVVGNHSENAEQKNIARRLGLTMNPGQIGFMALFNQAGAPIAYYAVKGKITSSGKRLTSPDERNCWSESCAYHQSASDEGTYGSSDPYVYFWTVDDVFIQWNGPYLYSDKPFRLRIEPLVISVAPAK